MWVEPIPLQLAHEVRCPQCWCWHAVVAMYREGTDYTRQMLFFECRRGQYYAGQVDGQPLRDPMRVFVAASQEGMTVSLDAII